MQSIIYFLGLLGWVLASPLSRLQPIQVHVNSSKTVDDVPGARIIGGREVEPNSAPYQVAVVINGLGLCGGSLISTTTVLTAAHCTIIASFVELRLGAHYFDRNEETQIRLTSARIINHEGYDDRTFQNDISVVSLPSAVTLNSAIQVIPLAPATAPDYEGSPAFLTGWGFAEDFNISQFLRGVSLTIISNDECSRFFSIIRDSMICTSGVGPVGGCSSDSGGPLVVDGVQVGVLVFGGAACVGGLPTGYARVSWYRNWIQTNSGV